MQQLCSRGTTCSTSNKKMSEAALQCLSMLSTCITRGLQTSFTKVYWGDKELCLKEACRCWFYWHSVPSNKIGCPGIFFNFGRWGSSMPQFAILGINFTYDTGDRHINLRSFAKFYSNPTITLLAQSLTQFIWSIWHRADDGALCNNIPARSMMCRVRSLGSSSSFWICSKTLCTSSVLFSSTSCHNTALNASTDGRHPASTNVASKIQLLSAHYSAQGFDS